MTPTSQPTPPRCAWSASDPLLREYHDLEWGREERDSRALWEMLVLEGFQAGLSWLTILRKREAFRAAFAGFDPDRVARFGDAEVLRLMADPGIVRSRAKIEATVSGARIFCDMRDRGEDFGEVCWAYVGGQTLPWDGTGTEARTPLSERVSKDLRRRGFKFVGPTIVHAWMQATGMVDGHALDCFRRASPRGRKA